MPSPYTPGDAVRVVANRLGTLERESDSRFADEIIDAGVEGLYVGPHADEDLAANGWHTVRVEVKTAAGDDVVRFAPVHVTHIEPAR